MMRSDSLNSGGGGGVGGGGDDESKLDARQPTVTTGVGQPGPTLSFSDDGTVLQPSPGKPVSTSTPITKWNKLIYVAPFFVVACAEIFYQTYQTKYYVSDLRMSPTHYALFNAIVRSVDLFTFPLLGWLTDNTFINSWLLPRGRRRPFIAFGAPLVALSLYLLFSPPQDAKPHTIAVWYTTFAIIYHVVPLTMSYSALAVELTKDYDEQASVFGWANVSASLGRLAGALGPGVLVVAVTADHRSIFPLFSAVLGGLILLLYWNLVAAIKVPRTPFEVGRRGNDGALWEQPMFILPVGSGDEAMSLWQCAVSRQSTGVSTGPGTGDSSTSSTDAPPARVRPSLSSSSSSSNVPRPVFEAASRQLRAQWLDAHRQHDWDVALMDGSTQFRPVLPPQHQPDLQLPTGFGSSSSSNGDDGKDDDRDDDDDARSDDGLLHHARPAANAPSATLMSPFNLPITPLPIAPGLIWATRNPALVVLVFTESLIGVTKSMINALAAFYVQFVLQPTQAYELWLGIGFSSFLLFAAIGTVVWEAVAHKYDQRTAFLFGIACSFPAGIGMMLLGRGDIYWYCLLQGWSGFSFGGSLWLLGAMRASAIDYDHLYLGMRREAQYLTYINVPVHWVDIPLTALAFGLLESSGFNPDADDQPEATQRALRLLFVLIPTSCTLLAWIVAWKFPITRAIHEQLFPAASRADTPAPAPPASPSPLAPGASPRPFTSLETPRDQVVQLTQHGGVAMIDPLKGLPILPPRYYRSASLDWLLDHFGTSTVAHLVQQRQAEAARGVPTYDLEFQDVIQPPSSSPADPDDTTPTSTAVHQKPARVSIPTIPAQSKLLGVFPMSLFHKELTLAMVWGANTAAAVFCVLYGLLEGRNGVAIVGMLWTGLSGLLVMFYAVRVDAAKQMDTVPLAALQRYLRVMGVQELGPPDDALAGQGVGVVQNKKLQ